MTRTRVWDVTIHEEEETTKTIRGLTQAQTIALLRIIDRRGIPAEAIEYDSNYQPTGQVEAVNI